MTNDPYLPFHAAPQKPNFTLPDGAVDAHCHVFGPAHLFPFSKSRKYTPCDAPKEKLFALRDHLGFARNVIVQASCHGQDNAALIDALLASDGRARGVAIVDHDIDDNSLLKMDQAGIRGIRFNFVKRLVDPKPKDILLELAKRVHKLGWHIVVYFEMQDLDDVLPFLQQIPNDVVIDHMGRPNISEGISSPEFQNFLSFIQGNGKVWTKVSCPERLSSQVENYTDIIPFAKTILETAPHRTLWGTDWPHPNMKSHMPDDGELVNFITDIAPTKTQRQTLLVDNPMALYWPELCKK